MGGPKRNNHAKAHVISSLGGVLGCCVMYPSEEWLSLRNRGVRPWDPSFVLSSEECTGLRWTRGGGPASRCGELYLQGRSLTVLWRTEAGLSWVTESLCHRRVERKDNWVEEARDARRGISSSTWRPCWSYANCNGKPAKHWQEMTVLVGETRSWEGLGRPVSGLLHLSRWGSFSRTTTHHIHTREGKDRMKVKDTLREKSSRTRRSPRVSQCRPPSLLFLSGFLQHSTSHLWVATPKFTFRLTFLSSDSLNSDLHLQVCEHLSVCN